MGRLSFSSWTLHLSRVMIFGTILGSALDEWRSTVLRVRAIVWGGVAVLVVATIIIGYGKKVAAG